MNLEIRAILGMEQCFHRRRRLLRIDARLHDTSPHVDSLLGPFPQRTIFEKGAQVVPYQAMNELTVAEVFPETHLDLGGPCSTLRAVEAASRFRVSYGE